MKRDRNGGFTLVELLVVISILALLIGMLTPTFSRARRTAKRAVCGTHLRQIGVAIRSYFNESNDTFFYRGVTNLPSIAPEATTFTEILADHGAGDPKVFECPADQPRYFQDERDPPNTGKRYFDSERSSYQFNDFLAGRKIEETARRMRDIADVVVAENQIWLTKDFQGFHARAGEPHAANYLYSDGHVSDLEHIQ